VIVSYTLGYSTGVQITTVKSFVMQVLVLDSIKKCQISEGKISILIGSFNEEKLSVQVFKFSFQSADLTIFGILLLSLNTCGYGYGCCQGTLTEGEGSVQYTSSLR
jgi:hypothetical protein